MAFIQKLGQLRSPVSTYANLPITGNVLGDLRILTDVGVLYTWTSESSSGDLTNWKKVTVSSYNDLTGRPSASILAINNISTCIRNIMMNSVLIFFKKTITYGITIQKMVDGLLDNFQSTDTVDETESENYKWIKAQGTNTYDYFYVPTFNSDFDEYTKILLTAREYATSGFDECRNIIINIWSQETPHFSERCIITSPYGTGSSTSISYWGSGLDLAMMSGLDFTWDFWVRYNGSDITGEKNILQYSSARDFFKIKKLDNHKIYCYMPTCDGYVWDNGLGMNVPVNLNEIEITGTTVLSSDTWYHVAIERASGYLKLYINGVLEATASEADNRRLAGDSYVILGYESYPTLLDELRYSHGIARYSSNFTPMTVPYNTPTEEAPCDNMVIQSQGFEANAVPTSARIVIFQDYTEQEPPDIEPNEDIKAYVSRDGGTTFTEVELAREMDIMAESYSSFLHSSVNFYVGTVDLSAQPTGKMMVWKITTHNNMQSWIRSASLQWA